jgi:hypothetical protein
MHAPGNIHFNDRFGIEHGKAGQAFRFGLRLSALQFTGRADGHQFQDRFGQDETIPRLPADNGDQADGLPARIPQGGSDLALGPHLPKGRIPGIQMAHIAGE